MGETGETCTVEVHRQGLVTSTQGVYSHVEFTTSEEQRVQQVALADVLLYSRVPTGRLPLGNITNLAENEDTPALALRGLSYTVNLQVSLSRDSSSRSDAS